MQQENFIKGLKTILMSLSVDELREVIDADILERIHDFETAEVLSSKEISPQAKENIFERLKELGIERFNDAKETFSETVHKIDLKKIKDRGEKNKDSSKKQEDVLKNNPFLKLKT